MFNLIFAVIDTFLTIKSVAEGLYKDRGSRFCAYVHPISSAEHAKPIVDMLKEQYHDARHHCYAYRIGQQGEIFRIVDDGEPSGTAGRPILGALQSRGVTNILAVVVRYFGGTKLGTSGLINAYKEATLDALNNAQIIEKTLNKSFSIEFGYSQINEVMKLIKAFSPDIISQRLESKCEIELEVRLADAEALEGRLATISGLTIKPQHI